MKESICAGTQRKESHQRAGSQSEVGNFSRYVLVFINGIRFSVTVMLMCVVVFEVSDSESSSLVVAVGVVVGLLIAFALVILLVLLYRSRKVKGKRRAISSSGNHFSVANILCI